MEGSVGCVNERGVVGYLRIRRSAFRSFSRLFSVGESGKGEIPRYSDEGNVRNSEPRVMRLSTLGHGLPELLRRSDRTTCQRT